jgi:ABC-type glycerol-3-phosphate transport system permease component
VKRTLAVLVHVVLVAACAFAVYPLLWVITLALSPFGPGTEARIFPLASAPSLHNFRTFLGLDSS